MLVTTTDVIQGAVIDSYCGIVTAEVVYGSNALRDFLLAFAILSAVAPPATSACLKRDSRMPSLSWKNGQIG